MLLVMHFSWKQWRLFNIGCSLCLASFSNGPVQRCSALNPKDRKDSLCIAPTSDAIPSSQANFAYTNAACLLFKSANMLHFHTDGHCICIFHCPDSFILCEVYPLWVKFHWVVLRMKTTIPETTLDLLLIYDHRENARILFWVSVPGAVDAPLGAARESLL